MIHISLHHNNAKQAPFKLLTSNFCLWTDIPTSSENFSYLLKNPIKILNKNNLILGGPLLKNALHEKQQMAP